MKLLHTGDLHLGTPFRGLPEPLAARRRQEQLELLNRVGELARREAVEVTLIAGDLFDAPRPPAELVRRTAEALSRFPGRLFLAPGNHDYLAPDGPYAKELWPQSLTVFRSPRLTPAPLPALDAVVWGAAFTAPEEPDSPLAGVGALPGAEGTKLLLLHTELNGAEPRYAPVTGAELAASGACYAALGHLHAPTEVLFAGKTAYAYCGCPEGRGFDETERRGGLGVLVGTAGPEGVSLRRVPVALRRTRELSVPLAAGQDPLAAVLAALPPETERDLYRLTLTGTAAEPPDLAVLEAALRDRFFYLELREETRPPEDLWAAAGEPTLRGLFLAALKREREKDPALYDQAARYGLAALAGEEPPEEGEGQ